MRLFGRKKTDSDNVPPEIQDYYQAERRDKTGLAWLLAAGTLLLTVLVVLGLFFGGRWAYRAVTNDDNNGQTASEQSENSGQQNEQAPTENDSAEQNSTDNEEVPAPTPPSTAPSTPPPAPAETPRTGPSEQEALPATGPASTLAVFLAVTAIASLVHYKLRQTMAQR